MLKEQGKMLGIPTDPKTKLLTLVETKYQVKAIHYCHRLESTWSSEKGLNLNVEKSKLNFERSGLLLERS